MLCLDFLCFVPPDTTSGSTKLFGFSEFLASLALLVVIFTVSDIRYKFRIAIAPIPLYGITFFIISLTGFGSLISDIWVSQKWWVLKTNFEMRITFQSILGFLFLSCFMLWIYFAFIRPPKFSKGNYKKYIKTLYLSILKGNDSELAIIADELGHSATKIVSAGGNGKEGEFAQVANEIMLLMANRKFCKVIARESPITAYQFFYAMSCQKKFNVPLGQFCVVISEEVLINKDSVVYHEDSRYGSGLMGYTQQWSKSLYGNSQIVDALSECQLSPFDIDYRMLSSFDADKWEAYGRLICIYLEDVCCKNKYLHSSFSFAKALDNYKHCTRNLYTLNNNSDDILRELETGKAYAAVSFIKDIFRLVNKINVDTNSINNQSFSKRNPYPKDLADNVAELMFDIIIDASRVKSRDFITWEVQNNIVWKGFFGSISFYEGEDKSDFYKKTRGKLFRLLYDEINSLEELPNYKNIKLAGMLINIYGVDSRSSLSVNKGKDQKLLKIKTIEMLKKHYLSIYNDTPDVADSMLGGGISFDDQNLILIKTYTKGLRKEAPREILILE
ncbi:hypothetical protein [Serratia fonticola]|uniref:hypothetical protein n=1 Tax=Serratia fonticola TaxID=47917 RepID=UPI00192CF2F4|nr:hypothetical protein [Serratia fonticola]MBL5827132.1 hypothetical protein [Serratia fonticola]